MEMILRSSTEETILMKSLLKAIMDDSAYENSSRC